MEYFGYVYIWFDTVRRKFCIGSHHGQLGDGYLTSTGHCARAIQKRPSTFRFRVLEYCTVNDKKETLRAEQRWLDKIKENELGKRYYNLKKFAAGGNTIQAFDETRIKEFKEKCSKASKKYWSNLNEDQLEKIKKNAFGGNNFDRSYLQNPEYRRAMSISTRGSRNGFYGKTHTDEVKAAVGKRSLNNKYHAKEYLVITKDGVKHGPFIGCPAIADYFNLKSIDVSIKWYRFIGKNIPISSTRKDSQKHPLYGAIVEVI